MSNNSTKKTTTVNKAKKVSEVTNVENKDVNVTNNDLVDNQENNTNIKPKYTVQDYTQLKNIILEGLEDVIANKGKVQL